jgi:hypothetical protein
MEVACRYGTARNGRMSGAHNRNRTCDLFLTKEVLYRLSYMSVCISAVLPDGEEQTGILPDSSKMRRLPHCLQRSTCLADAAQWSGRRESNPRNQFGKLMFYH